MCVCRVQSLAIPEMVTSDSWRDVLVKSKTGTGLLSGVAAFVFMWYTHMHTVCVCMYVRMYLICVSCTNLLR